jgi:hypothetical protein
MNDPENHGTENSPCKDSKNAQDDSDKEAGNGHDMVPPPLSAGSRRNIQANSLGVKILIVLFLLMYLFLKIAGNLRLGHWKR